MSDITLNKFLTYGTHAARLGFTPSPPVGVSILYEWYETDTGDTYVYDSAWHLVGGGSSSTLRVEKTLTNANIKALPTTPFELLAAPAAGVRFKPVGLTYKANFTAGAYTNIDAAYAALQVGPTGTGLWLYNAIADDVTVTGQVSFTNLFGSAAAVVTLDVLPYIWAQAGTGAQYVNSAQFTSSDLEAKALALSIDNNGSGNLTGGNAANTLVVAVYYAPESL